MVITDPIDTKMKKSTLLILFEHNVTKTKRPKNINIRYYKEPYGEPNKVLNIDSI